MLIPIWGQNAAALTTVVAELISMMMCFWFSRVYYIAEIVLKEVVAVLLGCVCIIIYCHAVRSFIKSLAFSTVVSIGGSIVVYGLVLVLFKHSVFSSVRGIFKRLNND